MTSIGDLGCICNVAYDETKCRALVDLAIPCVRHGPRVFEGFTVGFNPQSWEVVYNGMTQTGFEKPHHQFSFGDEQVQVALYLTAVSSLSGLVGKPTFQVNSSDGLLVRLSGSAARGDPPTTLSPSVLLVNWRCNSPGVRRYAVDISIPVEGYDPIEFTLTKECERHGQGREDDAMKGWATFGIISCITVVLSTVFCCGRFIYKTRVEKQHGLDALPGMTILSACLEAVSGPRRHHLGEDNGGHYVNQASWDCSSTFVRTRNTGERRYGST